MKEGARCTRSASSRWILRLQARAGVQRTPHRSSQEDGYYFVTSRCFQGRLLLRPSAEVNEVVGGVLAKAVQQSGGNDLLVWTRGVALASFMQYLRVNLSKKVGRLVAHRKDRSPLGRSGREQSGRRGRLTGSP